MAVPIYSAVNSVVETPTLLISSILDCLLCAKLCAVNFELVGIQISKHIARATISLAQLHLDFPKLPFLPFAIFFFFCCTSYTNTGHLKKNLLIRKKQSFALKRYESESVSHSALSDFF